MGSHHADHIDHIDGMGGLVDVVLSADTKRYATSSLALKDNRLTPNPNVPFPVLETYGSYFLFPPPLSLPPPYSALMMCARWPCIKNSSKAKRRPICLALPFFRIIAISSPRCAAS